MKIIKYIVFGVIVVIIAGFSALNAESVAVNYYWGEIRMPMALLLAIVFILAVTFSSLLFLKRIVNLRMKIRSLEKKAAKCSKAMIV
ncbi:lipopolysaccharide assembly protein LapA domain-containing protein [Piscirickettsia litoralis]|uniref:Lipopolysaccharide assembly protein A domain-containing protein n=1 Tax=Piscirickettsia litoralis TaxID=1891921 RepID=A0ABX3A484_9GAMM|nr:LapA family protein [Piscirickettsia litoralis]ODN43666.1 hypothetical protein BGC07_13100 [Piscirickettsia litoralis]